MIIPIKKSLFVLSTAIVMGSTIQSACATEHVPSQTITQDNLFVSAWEFIQEIDGVSVFYRTVTVAEEQFLSVKFENTNSETVDFIWSMTKNNATIRITADEMIESRVQLDSSTYKVYDGGYLIELTDEDQFSDFVVSIKPTKH